MHTAATRRVPLLLTRLQYSPAICGCSARSRMTKSGGHNRAVRVDVDRLDLGVPQAGDPAPGGRRAALGRCRAEDGAAFARQVLRVRWPARSASCQPFGGRAGRAGPRRSHACAAPGRPGRNGARGEGRRVHGPRSRRQGRRSPLGRLPSSQARQRTAAGALDAETPHNAAAVPATTHTTRGQDNSPPPDPVPSQHPPPQLTSHPAHHCPPRIDSGAGVTAALTLLHPPASRVPGPAGLSGTGSVRPVVCPDR
ncbi:hypothetical protein M2160_000180 [Streptomyces sp. SAI-117]|nr:hypothetical protein [Streptomyces sp. SAI-117]